VRIVGDEERVRFRADERRGGARDERREREVRREDAPRRFVNHDGRVAHALEELSEV
jgi:hypothetical protein